MKAGSKFQMFVGMLALLLVVSICTKIFISSQRTSMSLSSKKTYPLYAEFSNIGELKLQAPVKIAGITVGRVQNISLNTDTWGAKVQIYLEKRYGQIPSDSRLCIRTSGLLGETYLEIKVGDETQEDYLVEGAYFSFVEPAVILEDLLAKLIFTTNPPKSQPFKPA